MNQETIEASIAHRIEAYWMQRGHKVAVRVTGTGNELGIRSTLVAGLPERYVPITGDASLAVERGK